MCKSIYLIAGALLFLGCSKEDIEPLDPVQYSEVPDIKVGIKQKSIEQFGTIEFNIFYRDGDGNIGTRDADDHSVEIIDKRAEIVHTYHVPPLSVIENVIIEGILTVELENVILLDQDNNSESITFEVRLKDADGNWSKKYTTKPVTVTK